MKEIIKEIEKMKCEVPKRPTNQKLKETEEEFCNKCVFYAGRFNYNKALKDVLSYLKKYYFNPPIKRYLTPK